MKPCLCGALALFAALSAASAQARDCGCPPHRIARHTVVRHAPARHAVHVFHDDADAEYAQSYYDYHSSSTVEETITSTVEEEHGPWQVAPDDAHIRFHHREGYDSSQYEGAGFSGGVGDYEGAAGYGGYGNMAGFRDGFGQMHFDLNGPSYNSYGESFQAGGGVQGRFDFGRGDFGRGDFGRGGVGPNMRRGNGR